MVRVHIAILSILRYRRPSGKPSGNEEGGQVGGNELVDFWQWLLRQLLLPVSGEGCVLLQYCATTTGGVWWEGARQHQWPTGSCHHHWLFADIMPFHIPHMHTHAPCIKIYRDKQHTRSICCLQLTHSETTAGSAAAWKRLWVKQVLYPISQRAWWSSSSALLPLPLAMQSAAMGQARCLNCQPAAYIPALPRTALIHVCVLMSFIRISLVVSPARYRRHSLSHDIVEMCGWRSKRLIDIIPIFYFYK